jgi:hypothetical protein
MFRLDSPSEAAFREEFRAWLEANLLPELRFLAHRPHPDKLVPWYRRFAATGWVAPHWPKEYGGMQASPGIQMVMMEELVRVGAPDLPAQGLNHIGPILIEMGSAQQRALHLPRIVSGEVIWCQGYSEPSAGSDLASLRTSAVVDGDHLVINGQKIWTTWAHHAQWMFALVRTGPVKPKQAGITFVLVDLATPGITRRPIVTVSGEDELAEVFLDNVRVPISNVVGEINGGWKVATALLDHERPRSGSPHQALRALERVKAVARLTGAVEDPGFQDRLVAAAIEVEGVVAAFLHAAELSHVGRTPSAEASFLKIIGTETVQRLTDLLQEAAGPLAGLRDGLRDSSGPVDLSGLFLQSRKLSIYGGSNEIQRNILANRVLGLSA